MTEYDLRETLESIGFDYTPGSKPVEGADWEIVNATGEELALQHPEGVKVRIIQQKPKQADLPFRVLRVTENGDEYQLGESDWADRVLNIAQAYMLGFTERRSR